VGGIGVVGGAALAELDALLDRLMSEE
jgi:hypothetical protein